MGEGVGSMKPGDRVYVSKNLTGAYAEYALALESQVHPLPAKITLTQGAGVWITYGTAYHALQQCTRTRASETVLIHGTSGGVGIAAVQITCAMGLVVIGTASSEKGPKLVKREGAEHVFDHSKASHQEQILEATNGRNVNVVLEFLANVKLGQDLKLLALQGRVYRDWQPRRRKHFASRPYGAPRLNSRIYSLGYYRDRAKKDSRRDLRRTGERHFAARDWEGIADCRGCPRSQGSFKTRSIRQDSFTSVMLVEAEFLADSK